MAPPTPRPKRSRARPYNQPKMTRERAKAIFDCRNLHPEKEFLPSDKVEFYKIATSKGYGKLLEQRQPGNETIVREFYIETRLQEYLSIDFRGKTLDMTATDFQQFFKLPNIYQCQYQLWKANSDDVPWDQILETLAVPGTTWRVSGSKWYLDRKHMKDETRIWLNFMNSNVAPIAHMSDVTREGAMLLFLLMGNFEVDIPLIAVDALMHCAMSDTANLIFPHFISDWCAKKGIKADKSDRIFKPIRSRGYAPMTANPRSTGPAKKKGKRAMEEGEGEATEEEEDESQPSNAMLLREIRELKSLVIGNEMARRRGPDELLARIASKLDVPFPPDYAHGDAPGQTSGAGAGGDDEEE